MTYVENREEPVFFDKRVKKKPAFAGLHRCFNKFRGEIDQHLLINFD